jgi:hypothetical protein
MLSAVVKESKLEQLRTEVEQMREIFGKFKFGE